jgi:hypothetical protein
MAAESSSHTTYLHYFYYLLRCMQGATKASAAAAGSNLQAAAKKVQQKAAAAAAAASAAIAAAEPAPSPPAAGGPKGTLIVCPLSVLSNWQTQIEEHTAGNLQVCLREVKVTVLSFYGCCALVLTHTFATYNVLHMLALSYHVHAFTDQRQCNTMHVGCMCCWSHLLSLHMVCS